MFLNATRLHDVIWVMAIIKLIMFIRFIRIVGAFRIINANEFVFGISDVKAVMSVNRIIRTDLKQDRLNAITATQLNYKYWKQPLCTI